MLKSLKITALVFAVLIVVLLGAVLFWQPARGPIVANNTTSTPDMISADGHMEVLFPLPGALLISPATVIGKVKGGGWFFEATFPVKILDGDGTVIGQGVVNAEGEPGSWMSTGTVPFSGQITFTTPKYATGTIVFEKDNPSGAENNAMEFSLPVTFK
jgi:hypothetical protein